MQLDRPSWLWPTENGVCGLVLDLEEETLHWYEAVSNLCGDDGSRLEQPLATFRTRGVPAVVGDVPHEVLQELHAAIRTVGKR